MVMQIKRVVVVVVVVVYIPGMQPRFKEFRHTLHTTLCIPQPMFQQLDSRFSAMLVLASLQSLLVDVLAKLLFC